jgi:hypothetical protein
MSDCGVRESVAEVDLEGCERVGPVVAGLPFRFGSLDGEVDELGGGLFVGVVAAGLDRLADLAVEVLDAVGGVDGSAGRARKGVMCCQRVRQESAIIG